MAVGVVCAGGWPASWGTCCAGGVAPTVTPPVGIVAPTPVTMIYFPYHRTRKNFPKSNNFDRNVKALWIEIDHFTVIQQSAVLDVPPRPPIVADDRIIEGIAIRIRKSDDESKETWQKSMHPSTRLFCWTSLKSRPLATDVWARLTRWTANVFYRAVGAWHPVECLVAALSVEGTFSGEHTSGGIQRVTL